MDSLLAEKLRSWAERYNHPRYFIEDPIAFPRRMALQMTATQPSLGLDGEQWRPSLQDVEITAVFASHFAWGRRAMIVRNCSRLFEEMMWRPYNYVMSGSYRNDNSSIHRTIKWKDVAGICRRLRDFYSSCESLEELDANVVRTEIFGQKPNPKAANKKIWLMRRWMVRRDGKVDLGLWRKSSPADLIIPLDVHVHTQAESLGLCKRRSKDLASAQEITDAFREIFPNDPVKGDFALFGYGITSGR